MNAKMIRPEKKIIFAYPTITVNLSSLDIRFIPKIIKSMAIPIPNNGKFFILSCFIVVKKYF